MDLAIAIFNIGVGLGVLTAGAALAYLAWQTTPLIRESRALAKDLRRLSSLAEDELRPLIGQAQELGGSVEVLSEDAAVKLDRIGQVLGELQQGLESGRLAVGAGRSGGWSVESAQHTREDDERG